MSTPRVPPDLVAMLEDTQRQTFEYIKDGGEVLISEEDTARFLYGVESFDHMGIVGRAATVMVIDDPAMLELTREHLMFGNRHLGLIGAAILAGSSLGNLPDGRAISLLPKRKQPPSAPIQTEKNRGQRNRPTHAETQTIRAGKKHRLKGCRP